MKFCSLAIWPRWVTLVHLLPAGCRQPGEQGAPWGTFMVISVFPSSKNLVNMAPADADECQVVGEAGMLLG